jgi:hypothetical protein
VAEVSKKWFRLRDSYGVEIEQGQCYVQWPFVELNNGHLRLEDLTGDATYDREGDDLQAHGLYLDVPPCQAHVFSLTKPG